MPPINTTPGAAGVGPTVGRSAASRGRTGESRVLGNVWVVDASRTPIPPTPRFVKKLGRRRDSLPSHSNHHVGLPVITPRRSPPNAEREESCSENMVIDESAATILSSIHTSPQRLVHYPRGKWIPRMKP